MHSKINYSLVGVFVIILGLSLVYITFWLSAGGSAKNYEPFLVSMRESVSGLSVQSPVKYNGVKVGYVDSIRLNPHNPREVKLILYIEENIPIHTGTVATLETQGITGVAYIGLSGGNAQAPLIDRQPKKPYPEIPSKPSLLMTLDKSLRKLTGNFDAISKGFKSLLDVQNQQAFSETLQNLKRITQVLRQNSQRIDQSIQQLNVTLNNTAQASQNFPIISKDVKKSAAAVVQLTAKLNRASGQVERAMRAGRVLINNFDSQLLPQTQVVLQQISAVSSHLNRLSSEMAQNPAILLRGKQVAPPGPGE